VIDPFKDHASFRDALVDRLIRQVFGPLPDAATEEQSEVLTISPLQLYATGVLFPQKVRQETLEDSSDVPTATEEEVLLEEQDPIEIDEGKRSGGSTDAGSWSDEQEPLNLANEFSPSAVGISFRIKTPAALIANISYGRYEPTKVTEAHPRAGDVGMDGRPFPATREIQAWKRIAHARQLPLEIGKGGGPQVPIKVDDDGNLTLRITIRPRDDGTSVVSAMLVNEKRGTGTQAPSCADVYFQIGLSITEASRRPIFLPIDRSVGVGSGEDPEVASMDLLFRHRRAFALGHGTAGDWNRDEKLSEEGATDCVSAAAVPSYDLKPIRPRHSAYRGNTSLRLSMRFLHSPEGGDQEIIGALTELAEDYEAWIGDQKTVAGALTLPLDKAAASNIANCEKCAVRIRKGIDLLNREPDAMLAFRLMNKAMYVQQYHSRLKRRELGSEYPPSCPPDDISVWYPFQLAFILMNLASTFDPDDDERRLVDLIWFPTGGGKTEAYLGLSAFTIILGRLRGDAPGTTVLMRYTLRLLTAQQFQRASALVLALELIRRNRELDADLGTEPISIGLWVGKSLSPNSRDEARARLRQLREDRFAPNPFQALQCPWCGVDFTDRAKLGYEEVRPSDGGQRTVALVCPDKACAFSSAAGGLPILVIDEDIYQAPPTILIGTVDKFAQVAWDDNVGRLFGLGTDHAPPSLVIQDELHLISGPLGTIVGLYETAIDRLCSRDGFVHKIVASTATIRRSAEQCWGLYSRRSFEFPPQAIRAGESYFAFEDRDAPGRRYVGFMGNAVKSHQTALVRACSPLLQGVCYPLRDDEDEKRAIADPYGTLVWYFNSLRELGHAATLCVGDIPEFLKGLCHRQNIPYENRRYIREIIELTSRRGAEEIPEILQQLEIPWRMKPVGRPPVDILLATNMIAVGVDVSRLGLIVMSGQPKGTSEYIQASSRVGRSVPGLVVTIYTQTKSRDRSHYERFVAYHQSLYRHVEPTSVTPFSPQARERGIRGVLVALARLIGHVDAPNKIGPLTQRVEEQIEAIISRAEAVDPDEVPEAREELSDWLAFWKRYSPPLYGKMGGAVSEQTLMYPYGGVPDESFQRDAWPVLTSMRNVDGTSTALVLNTYQPTESGEE
jgi:hypothetical protein